MAGGRDGDIRVLCVAVCASGGLLIFIVPGAFGPVVDRDGHGVSLREIVGVVEEVVKTSVAARRMTTEVTDVGGRVDRRGEDTNRAPEVLNFRSSCGDSGRETTFENDEELRTQIGGTRVNILGGNNELRELVNLFPCELVHSLERGKVDDDMLESIALGAAALDVALGRRVRVGEFEGRDGRQQIPEIPVDEGQDVESCNEDKEGDHTEQHFDVFTHTLDEV